MPNQVAMIPYGVFGVTRETITMMTVDKKVAIRHGLNPREIGMIPELISR